MPIQIQDPIYEPPCDRAKKVNGKWCLTFDTFQEFRDFAKKWKTRIIIENDQLILFDDGIEQH